MLPTLQISPFIKEEYPLGEGLYEINTLFLVVQSLRDGFPIDREEGFWGELSPSLCLF